MKFTEEQQNLLYVLSKVLSSISLFGLIIIILLILIFGNIKSFSFQLMISLMIVELVNYISILLPGGQDEDGWCFCQSILMSFSQMSSFIWVSLIAYTAFISIKIQGHLEKYKFQYRIGFNIVALGIPLLFTMITIVSNSIGFTGPWCWLKMYNMSIPNQVRILAYSWFAFNIISVVLNIFFIFKVIVEVQKHLGNKFTKRLKLYPIVQIITTLPYLINRLYNITSHKSVFFLMIVQLFAECARGLAYSIVFGLTDKVKDNIYEKFLKWKKKGVTKNELELTARSETDGELDRANSEILESKNSMESLEEID